MTAFRLTDEQRIEWLRLIRSENVGPRTFRMLLNRFGGAGAALDALPDLARRGGRPAIKVTSRAEALREIERAAGFGVTFIAMGEPDYPATLKAIGDAPPLIAVRGRAEILLRPCIAIVGSRNASAAGLSFTEKLARGLNEAGFVVVSGLARGIDTRAHRASLSGGTIAVLAGGHDRIYPSENQPLVQKIIEAGGAIVSEMPMEWEARARDFPRRNRIISGLSYGVVIVEGARKSGSMITARFALEEGREVFAVPGSPLDPRAEGPNSLLKNGATLCTKADDVTEIIAPLLSESAAPLHKNRSFEDDDKSREPLWDELDCLGLTAPDASFSEIEGLRIEGLRIENPDAAPEDDRARLMSLLGPSPIAVDELARQANAPIRNVQLVLLELELAGRLERCGGNTVALAVF